MPAMLEPACAIRPAETGDIPLLETLIAASARALGEGYYAADDTEAAITHVFGVDTELVRDGTYFIARSDAGEIIGCGGWSRRSTLFGGDRFVGRSAALLDPVVDAARIRAFFVAPGWARRGIGSLLLDHAEGAARAAGFTRAVLMATLPGVPFYQRRGYAAGEAIDQRYGDRSVRFVPMEKQLLHK